MNVRRFFYVGSKRSKVLHMADTHIDGNKTRCGTLMRAGWDWFHGADRKVPRCKRCEAA